MKRIQSGVCLILTLALFSMLTACGNKQPQLPQLSGSYSAEGLESTLIYTFEEGNVTAQFFVADYLTATYEGTYSFEGDGTLITLTFDSTQLGNFSLPAGVAAPGGVFSFEQGDGYIKIGSVQYDLQTS